MAHKNTKPFAGIEGGILALKLSQLLETRRLDEIILSTNDELSLDIGHRFATRESRLRIVERPEALCLSSTPLTDLIRYVPQVVQGPHILWTHVTTPIAAAAEYDAGIAQYFEALEQGCDSLISVMPFQNFLLNEQAELINRSAGNLRWPRTQDLTPLYEINHVMFIASTKVYKQKNDRVGSKPFLFRMDKIKSLDVDWEEDFLIAESVYEKLNRR